MAKRNHYEKILFVGTGGGNDIYSTILAAMQLRHDGWDWKHCDIAGVLSPFHQHSGRHAYSGKQYPVKHITENSKRYIVDKKGTTEIKFVDAAVAKLVAHHPELGINRVLGIPLDKGTVFIHKLFTMWKKKYDYIVLVDVGGDILYRGAQDWHILSPMFDAMILKAFVQSGAKGILFEAGPGTDGELAPEVLSTTLRSLNPEILPLTRSVVTKWDHLYKEWIASVRRGRTVPVTIDAFNSVKPMLYLDYRARAHMGTQKYYEHFGQAIDTRLCKNYYLINPKHIINPFAVSCNGPLQWFIKTQVAQHRTNCEVNLEVLHYKGKYFQFLTPSPLFAEGKRMTIIEYGLSRLKAGHCDHAFIFADDWKELTNSYREGLTVKRGPSRKYGIKLLVVSPAS